MKCRNCDYARRGYFKSVPEAYICVGVPEPFVIKDYPDAKCTECKDESVEVNNMNQLRQWLLDLFYEYNVRCDEKIEELVDDVEEIVENAGYTKS